MQDQLHNPVLLKETIENVVTNKSGIYFDATFGRGGHTEELLKVLNNDAKVIACDVDEIAFRYGKEKFVNDKRVNLYLSNFVNINIIAKIEFIDGFDGIIADLGVSSPQYDDKEYGFTFKEKAKLDLRLNKDIKITAADILNDFSQSEISDIIYNFGEDKNSRKIARQICEFRTKRKFEYTTDLVEVIEKIVPPNYLNKTLARVFQALRIYINDELNVLEQFVEKSITLLKPGRRMGIITFHSLEDRIVKEVFSKNAKGCICPPSYPVCVCGEKPKIKVIHKKPIVPTEEEIKTNYRARSAKLRVIEKL